jgi:hypothetical protein
MVTAVIITSAVALIGSVNPASAGGHKYGHDYGENQYERHQEHKPVVKVKKVYKPKKHHYHHKYNKVQKHEQAREGMSYREHYPKPQYPKGEGAACYDRPCYEPEHKPKSHKQH